MDVSSNIYNNNITLAYLTNPLYQSELSRKVQVRTEVDESDIKFYKKRILALTKEMFRGAGPSVDLKKIHNEYVISIIKHLKMTDKKDILQNEYESNCINRTPNPPVKFDIADANKSFMRTAPNSNTLDNFVISNQIVEKPKIYPGKKTIDLKEPALKTKGIRKKKKNVNK
jgi:hypothetical protein